MMMLREKLLTGQLIFIKTIDRSDKSLTMSKRMRSADFKRCKPRWSKRSVGLSITQF